MVSFQTKNPNLGKFWRTLDCKMLIYCIAIWNNLQTFGIFYDHLVNFLFIWYIFSDLGIMYQEKSGNPGYNASVVKNTLSVLERYEKYIFPQWDTNSDFVEVCIALWPWPRGLVVLFPPTFEETKSGSWDRIPPGYRVVAF
jgi:hypothetical protein